MSDEPALDVVETFAFANNLAWRFRFHAWQSSLLFTALFVLHLLISWSSFLSWVLFLADLALVGWLVVNAYRDADTLDRYVLRYFRRLGDHKLTVFSRYEVPIFGPIASGILDDE